MQKEGNAVGPKKGGMARKGEEKSRDHKEPGKTGAENKVRKTIKCSLIQSRRSLGYNTNPVVSIIA